jgi:hypothetical protein
MTNRLVSSLFFVGLCLLAVWVGVTRGQVIPVQGPCTANDDCNTMAMCTDANGWTCINIRSYPYKICSVGTGDCVNNLSAPCYGVRQVDGATRCDCPQPKCG